MVKSEPLLHLPTSQELPCSDETPVDNELQYLIPYLLLAILEFLWSERDDWFWGMDMGIHYLYENQRQPVIVPDAFLSLGVARDVGKRGRLSYVLWEEDYIPPLLVLEIVSKTYNDEYTEKKLKYAQLGVLYYLVYNPNPHSRGKHQSFELYRLEQGEYVRQEGEPYWMPEIGLAIGRGDLTYSRLHREWLLWYDQEGNPYPFPQQIVQQLNQNLEQAKQLTERERQLRLEQQQIAQRERQRAESLLRQAVAQLFSLGVSKEKIASDYRLSLEEVEAILEQ